MKANYEKWAAARLKAKVRCSVEGSISCIPLRNDPICQACYESDGAKEQPESSSKKEAA